MLASASLWAHDSRLHQSNATTGDVVAVADQSFDLKTAKGNVKVTFDAKTKFEEGGAPVDKNHLIKGGHVGVIGTKLATGELVAKEVLLGVEQDSDHAAKGKTKGAASEHKH